MKTGNASIQKEINAEFEAKKAKKREEEEKALIASLYKTVDTVKSNQEDPKSIVCAYFKQGLCQKGKKCKFSHDLELEKTSEDIDLFTDQRIQIYGQSEEDPEKWDEKKLAELEKLDGKNKKHGGTKIICKFFLDAVENRVYGWKWVCPNGMGCVYRYI